MYDMGVLRLLEKLDLPGGAWAKLRIVGIYGLLKVRGIDPQELKDGLRKLHGWIAVARYYSDTYALVEILRGSPAYESYAGGELVTCEFNLLELAYALTRDYGKKKTVEILKMVRVFYNYH